METIRESVRAKYAETAIKLRDGGSCCDPGCCAGSDALSGPIGQDEYSSADVADRLLQEAGVATLAGTCFGGAGEGYLRLSYANSLANLQKAVSRIAEWSSRVAPLPTG